jgi:tetratricopeptide (TPR) repeat protein
MAMIESKPALLQPAFRNLQEEGQRSKVLNLMDIGVIALRAGYTDEAWEALEQARLEIESVYADSDSARRARSVWYEESEKDFKGEPYERAMVYLYLGLIHLQRGDYGNARASFVSGLLQDAFAEEEQYSSDFASLLYLAGWAARQMGSEQLAQDHFRELQLYRPDAPLPSKQHNTLLLVETGTAPRKLGDGVGHYQLVYRRGRNFTDVAAEVKQGQHWQPAYPIEDLYFQASTRGGRAIDRIVKGQIHYKESTRELGSNLTVVSQNSLLAGAGAAAGGALGAGFAAISLVSIAAQGMSAAANVRADIRYWRSLPDSLHILPLQARPGDRIEVRFLDATGKPVAGQTDGVAVRFDSRGRGLAVAGLQQPSPAP